MACPLQILGINELRCEPRECSIVLTRCISPHPTSSPTRSLQKPSLFEHRALQRQSTPQIDLRVRVERAALRTTRLFYGSAEAFPIIYRLYSDTLRPQSLKPHFEPPNQEIQGAACTMYFLKTTLQTGLQGSLRDLSCAHSPTSSFNVRQDCQSDSLPLKLKRPSGLPNCSERLLVPNSQSEISMSGMVLRDLSTGILIRTLIQRGANSTWPARSSNSC